MSHSALYHGWVRHRRWEAVERTFRYGLFMVYLDLDELDHVFRGRWLWSTRGPNLAWFRRQDYLGPSELPLDEAVRQRVEQELGRRPQGPIRVLTHLRYFGFVFNPVSFYYCLTPAGEVEAVVAEITNTPWGERHAYVLDGSNAERTSRGTLAWSFEKEFHVSPFFGMDHRYRWRFSPPGEALLVHMDNLRQADDEATPGERKVFDATLSLSRREITGAGLTWALLRYPFMTAFVWLAIYFQALLLWLRRVPYFPHPVHGAPATPAPDGELDPSAPGVAAAP